MSVTAILRDMKGSYLKDDDGNVREFLLPGDEPPATFDLLLPRDLADPDTNYKWMEFDRDASGRIWAVSLYRRFVNTGRWHALFDDASLYEDDALVYQEEVPA